ncbi:MAG: DNA topoisomerase 3 [Verrucomicrobiota bacterium]|nr:DNA topoisomerase 3 [Verrucomicrobiota bacterium]
MKSFIIAEKPSVARDIASAIGRFKKVEDWFENDEYIISSAVGHLVELFMPEDMDPKLKFWRLESLPIIPEKFQLKPIDKTKDRFKELKKLMAREDVGTIINACDAGREGELIFTYIYELGHCKKPVSRLWMQSMTQQGIRDAFAQLRNGTELYPLRDAARCRSEADWLIGINGTRAITTRMLGSRRGQVATVGRVQTPTLAMVVERERLIRGFVPRDYWRIIGEFGITEGEYEGVFQRANFKKNGTDEEDKAERVWSAAEANRVLNEVKAGSIATVSEEKKRTTQIAPRLYDLTTLQREANNRFGLPAEATLRIAQSLYEKHKAITYPRTDSRALPEDYIPTVKTTLAAIQPDFISAQKVLDEGWVKPAKRIFNNKEVSDHFAIIPTGESGMKLNADEAKIYDMIARRFIAVFYPSAEYDETTRLSVVSGHTFRTTGKVLVFPGWLEVYGRAEKNDNLTPLSPKDGKPPQARVLNFELIQEATKPPPRYTEATLLSAMEGAGKLLDDEELAAAMKEKGLGTPATRAATIEHVIREKYIERQSRELVPTAKAENLIDFLTALKADALTSPVMTGEWEHRLRMIEEKTLTRPEFMKAISDLTQQLVGSAKTFKENTEDHRTTDILSPTDGQPIVETLRAYKSQDGLLAIYKSIGNRLINESEVRTLVTERRIGPLDGFRSKLGKPFSAILTLDAENKVKFVFNNAAPTNGEGGEPGAEGTGAPLDLASLRVVGPSPVDGTPVYETSNAYACAKSLKGEKGFRLSRTLLGKVLTADDVSKLLKEGKTGLIENFKSKKTGRFFSAFLGLKPGGGIQWSFPPRAPKAAGAKKGRGKAAKSAEGETPAAGDVTIS